MKLIKEKVKEYFKDNWDVTLEQLKKDFKVTKESLPKLEKIVNQLIEEDWILKNYCNEHKVEEYDPGLKFGVWKPI